MIYNLKRDHARFRDIVKGKIKQDLKKYISHSEMIGKKGKELVSIPLPQIEIPHFRFGEKEQGGVGQGPGNSGDPVQPGSSDPQNNQAGQMPGQNMMEVEVSLAELAEILGEQLALPKIQPRGHKTIVSKKDRYVGISSQGPKALAHFKKSFKEALKRQIAAGQYSSDHPIVVPIKKDMRYRSWKNIDHAENNAVIIYMMDVSGSMGDEQKEIVRTEAFWIDTWLRSQYKGIETRYIVHDASAREVDEATFFRTRESGGTLISSAYQLCEKILRTDYNPGDWNIYPFHFSDGDNWSGEDTRRCMDLLENSLLPMVNIFCYAQVESRYGSGQFLKDLKEYFGSPHPSILFSQIENKDGILKSIQEFLGTGK